MSFSEVYIVGAAHFFPNSPVSNDDMELYLGLINGKPSKSKNVVLRNNGIKSRYYALDKNGQTTHTNAQMTALAVKELFKKNPEEIKSVQLLSCGTSTPDQFMPSHGITVHGWLPETGPIEVITPTSNCCAGMYALKYAYLAVKTGDMNVAVSTGSERSSRVLCSNNYEEEAKKLAQLEEDPGVAFEKDFLRWMLSDGAGAFLLSNKKSAGTNLRIEWIDCASYAYMVETCMYQTCEKMPDGSLKGYAEYTAAEIMEKSILSIKQDIKMLDKYIVSLGYDKLKEVIERRGLDVKEIDYFLPHLSSEYFRGKIAAKLEENGLGIPKERWFTNLSEIGNIGSASVYLMIDELMNSGKFKTGQKILLMVPESARFSYVYALLTVC